MHEEPLHLVPEPVRAELHRDLGLYIEGDLCPWCRQMVQDKYAGVIEQVPVQRITFSEKQRTGIGTFTPSDPKSQDISELTGSVDLSTIGEYGSESDPRAYRFDGELNIANRGIMEFVEMLKCDEKFLYGLLTLSQEQSIKTGRFAMIYADGCIPKVLLWTGGHAIKWNSSGVLRRVDAPADQEHPAGCGCHLCALVHRRAGRGYDPAGAGGAVQELRALAGVAGERQPDLC